MSVKIYHNPRCSKSRQTLQLIRDKQIEPDIVEYLTEIPDQSELNNLIKLLGISARDLLRTKEPEYKQLGLDDNSLTDDQIIKAMVEHPKLIERPIVVNKNKAAIGRPPENVLEIL